MQSTETTKKSTEAMKTRIAGMSAQATMRVSDDTMRWLFGTPDLALSPEQQFQQDFLGEKPDRAANRARRVFCTQHGLTAKQDKESGYWTFAAQNAGDRNGCCCR